MKHNTSLLPEPPVTPIESDGLANHWFGLERYPGGSFPRFTAPPIEIVQAIPSKSESDRAKGILTEFAAAQEQYNTNNPEPIAAAAGREQNVLRRHELLKRIDAMDPTLSAEAAAAMQRLRREAAVLGSILCTRLAEKLREDLLVLTATIETQRRERNWPVVEHLAGETIWYLHRDTTWNESQLRYLQVKAVGERLRDLGSVDRGVCGELDVLRHFLGIGGGLSPC